MDEPRWLAIARSDLGTSETKGPRHNPQIVEYFRAVGHAGIKDDETAWCAAFLGACLERAGTRSSRSLMARSYLNWGRALDQARPGAIVILSRGSNRALGHVGFYVRETATMIYLLGGNQGDKVSIAGFAKSRLLGMRWPDEAGSAIGASLVEVGSLIETALAHVLEFEGGYSNDPQDPGGPTNLGITLGTLAAYRGVIISDKARNQLIADLKRLSPQDAKEIYLKRYWGPARCGDLPKAVAFMQFDCAVNQGVGRASRLLQQAVGVEVDGQIGPLTLAAVKAADPTHLLTSYAGLREAHYRGLAHFPRFGRGWLRRLNAAQARAKALIDPTSEREIAIPAQAPPSPAPDTPSQPATAKETKPMNQISLEPDVDPAEHSLDSDQKWWARSLTIWGAVVSTLAAVLPALGPLLGIEISASDVQAIGDDMVRLVQALGGVVGLAMAIFGRLRASTRLIRQPLTVRV